MTAIDLDTDLRDHAASLARLEAAGLDEPLVSGAFDLDADDTGSPAAARILRQAAREALPAGTDDSTIEELVAALEELVRDAASDGHRGLFSAGPLSEPTRTVASVHLPPRNQLHVGRRATRFELARSEALARLAVGAVWAERGGVRWALATGHAEARTGELEGDTHHMRDTAGRTAQHDRGGSVDQPAGGHGKSNVERSAEEERERFAREVAEVVEGELGDAACILLQGTPEFVARLSSRLSPELQQRLEQVQLTEAPPTTDELSAAAAERAASAQYERAESLAAEALGGALGERAVVGPEAIEAAIEQGRVEHLVVHEDAVGHYGDATDTRWHEPRSSADRIEALVRGSLEQAGTVWFSRDDEGRDEGTSALEPVATLRW